MLNNLQNLYQGLRASTTRPPQTAQPLAQISGQSQQRDSSLNAVRQAYKQPQKRYSQAQGAGVSIDQENFNNSNQQEDQNRVAYHSKYTKNTTVDVIRQQKQAKSKSNEGAAPFRAMNNQKPPVVMQSTDSPPSCSLTCSPDRTIKKPASREEIAVNKAKKPLQIRCIECGADHQKSFVAYRSNHSVGNCEQCGNFRFLTSSSLLQSQTQFTNQVSHSLRDDDQSFKTEVPMDQILDKLIEDAQSLNAPYNPQAFYLANREAFVEWLFDLAEKLRVQPETFHHSVNMFDAYLMRSDIQKHLQELDHFQGQTRHNVVTLIALCSLFISAKYLEKTYPGIAQLLNYIGIPFCYDQFIAQEKDMLETLGWQIQFISIHNVLSHFLCQGIIFTSDRLVGQARPNLYTVQVLQHNCEIFTSLCLKKHEFLQYDTLTVACAIVMAARKICHLQELWPDELVAMTGDRLRQPQVKKCMRHIVSFYDEISCSVSNSAQSSPEHPSTVQKTIKRTQQASISTMKKKSRADLNRGDKSQEQTTSKKVPASVTRILTSGSASQNTTAANISVVNQNGSRAVTETVVTPAKNGMPRNGAQTKAGSVLKSTGSQDKTQNAQGKRSTSGPATQGIQRSVTKKELSSTKKAAPEESRFVKSIESRADSQPAKKTHSLQKQDSSVYLKGNNSLDKVLKRSQRSAAASSQPSMDQRGKTTASTAKDAKSLVSASMERERSVNSHQVASLQQAVANTVIESGKEGFQFLHKQSQYSKYSVVNATAQQDASICSNSKTANTTLKKVIPHPSLLRQPSNNTTQVLTSDQLPSQTSVNASLNKTKFVNSDHDNAGGMLSSGENTGQLRSNSVGFSNNLTTTAQTKASADHQQSVSGVMQQRSLAKQFGQMELGGKKGFVVNTLTTANQRASSSKSGGAIPSQSGLSSFVSKFAAQSSKVTGVTTPLATEQAAMMSNMLKINNLTQEPNEILMGNRSGSVGTTSSQGKPQLTKMPSTQRDTSATSGVNEPKVISCNYKKNQAIGQQPRFDYSSIQALMTNLKQTSNGSNQTTQSSSGSVAPKLGYTRSTSRGKDNTSSGLAHVSKLTALLGKPLSMAGRNNQVNSSASSGQVGSTGLSMNMFHPRPQNLRVKPNKGSSEIAQSQIVSATQRSGSFGKP